jgi:hypothetical protein
MNSSNYDELENIRSHIVERFYKRSRVVEYLNLTQIVTRREELYSTLLNEYEGIGEEVKEDISELFKAYGIKEVYIYDQKLFFHDTWWYECNGLKETDLDFYLPLFFKEFSLYPVSCIKASKLEYVYFCNDLIFTTNEFSQQRAAVPDYCPDQMAMIYSCGEACTNYCIRVIHHEYFHFIDYIDDYKIYGPDPEWEELNTPHFKYGNGGAMNRTHKELSPDIDGFLNFYSTTGIEEDKAEIFAHLFLYPDCFENEKNPILLKKFIFIKNLISNFDKQGMGQSNFWENLKKFRNLNLENI